VFRIAHSLDDRPENPSLGKGIRLVADLPAE
jgi:hypothetical protein